MDWGTHREVRDGLGTLEKVRYVSVDPFGGSERVGGPSRRSGTGRWTLLEVQNGSGDPW